MSLASHTKIYPLKIVPQAPAPAIVAEESSAVEESSEAAGESEYPEESESGEEEDEDEESGEEEEEEEEEEEGEEEGEEEIVTQGTTMNILYLPSLLTKFHKSNHS